MSVEGASAWAERMTQRFGERGAGILSGPGVFEVIRDDRQWLLAESNILQGAHRALLLCINISPLIPVTSCLSRLGEGRTL
jgi:hypothetical protein